jgi:hypothetical protein
MGRPPIHKKPMTDAERQRRHRERLRQDPLRRAWDAATKADRSRSLRELRAKGTAEKKANRAAKVKAIGDKIKAHNDKVEAEHRAAGLIPPRPSDPTKPYITGWLAGFP